MTMSVFTCESVTKGHPDKLADQVADAVLDAVLAQDPESRVACETYLTDNLAVIGGEVTSNAKIDVPGIARKVIASAGYTGQDIGFDPGTCAVITALHHQSPDISQGVNHALEERFGRPRDGLDSLGAGDMGTMYGYACNETPELMPAPLVLAHRLVRQLTKARETGALPYLRPDGKAQVTLAYENGRPSQVQSVVIAAQHDHDIDLDKTMRPDLIRQVLQPALPPGMVDYQSLTFLLNTTGKFTVGGPAADTGLSGRKQAVDTYGGMGRHGGSSFSGKDPTKVDRSGAYAARYVAKNIVAAGLAERCEIQISYAIGMAHPVATAVEAFGTERIDIEKLQRLIERHFDLRPGALIRDFELKRPIYQDTAVYGHFGRADMDFPWERTDKAEPLKEAARQAA
jgi:S-adenosylmethionine synthetase